MQAYPKRRKKLQGDGACVCGLSLVEVVVSFGIVVILLSIVFIQAGKFIEGARASSCASNLRQAGVALQLFLAENDGIMPYGVGPNQADHWYNGLGKYTEKPTLKANESIFVCPSKDPQEGGLVPTGFSYGLERSAGSSFRVEESTPIQNPVMFTDIASNLTASGEPTQQQRWLLMDSRWYFIDIATGGTSSAATARAPQLRHGARANVLFPDGSVSSLTKEEINSRLYGFDRNPIP